MQERAAAEVDELVFRQAEGYSQAQGQAGDALCVARGLAAAQVEGGGPDFEGGLGGGQGVDGQDAFGDVAKVEEQAGHGRIGQLVAGGGVQPAPRAILAQDAVLGGGGAGGLGQQVLDHTGQGGPVGGVDVGGQLGVEQGLVGIAEHVLGGRAGVQHAAVGAQERDGVAVWASRARVGLAHAGFGHGQAAAGALFGFAQLAGDGGGQAGEAVFDDKIVRAAAQGGGGLLFADGAGDDDEGQVLAAGAQELEGGRDVELREGIVGQHQVPRAGGQRVAEGGAGGDALDLGSVAGQLEVAMMSSASKSLSSMRMTRRGAALGSRLVVGNGGIIVRRREEGITGRPIAPGVVWSAFFDGPNPRPFHCQNGTGTCGRGGRGACVRKCWVSQFIAMV